MTDIPVRYKPTVDQEVDPATDKQYQQGCTPGVIGKIRKQLFQEFQRSVLRLGDGFSQDREESPNHKTDIAENRPETLSIAREKLS